MKKLLALFWGMTISVTMFAQNCTINGRMSENDFQGMKVYLVDVNANKIVDSTMIENGVFMFKMTVDEPYVALLRTEKHPDGNYYYLQVIAEPGELQCDMVTDDISGALLNEAFLNCRRVLYETYSNVQRMEEIMDGPEMKDQTPEAQEEAKEKSASEKQQFRNVVKEQLGAHKNDLVGALIFLELSDLNAFEYPEYVSMLEMMGLEVIGYKPIKEKMVSMERASYTAVGKTYINLDLTEFGTGKKVKLSNYVKGKVALVDFWASWCRPCRAEIPNLADLHKKYAADGLVVISLNVWDKPEAQAKAIKELNMTWIQVTDELKKATDTYGVEGIPQILLIGANGKILARDLRGENIERAVRKALNK